MNIRFASANDIPGILRLLLQVGDVHHRIRPDIFRSGALKYDENALKELLQDKKRPILIAESDAQVLGYCFCVLREYPEGGVSTARREVYIDDLCVDEASRGCGVAEPLYRAACAWAREQGCTFVTLNVWCGNDRAMAFYEKMGLRPRHIMMEIPLEESQC